MTGDEAARQARADRRRRTYSGEVVGPAEDKPALYSSVTALERLVALCELSERQWLAANAAPVRLPRAQWPGEIFEVFGGDRSTE